MVRALELRKAVDAGISRSLDVIGIAWVTAVRISRLEKKKRRFDRHLGSRSFL
jgi:hypothetical protein